jgi:hypothetical protein
MRPGICRKPDSAMRLRGHETASSPDAPLPWRLRLDNQAFGK